MNFQQLNYAIAVSRKGHFGHAADDCDITQATLSGMIKKLEEEIGFEIFDRSLHPIASTEKGKEFLKLAEEILELQEEILTISKQQYKLEGSIRLGIIPTVASSLLPLILERLISEHPKLELNILELTTEEIVRQLRERNLDFGILSTPLPNELELASEEILYYESMHVYGYNESNIQNVNAKELKNKKVWLLNEGNCFRNQSMAICGIQSEENSKSNINFKSNSFDTLLKLSDQFGGYTLIPELYLKSLPKKLQRKTKSFTAPIPVREISLVGMSKTAKKDSMKILSDLIREEIQPKLSTSKYANKDLNIISM